MQEAAMKRASIVAGALAALSIPVFTSAQEPPDVAAARLKLVTSVQAKLGVPADGEMGPQTHAAIKQFQQSKGLEASGQLDKETVVALGLDAPNPSAAAG